MYGAVCTQSSLLLPGFRLDIKETLSFYQWHWSYSHVLAIRNKATVNVFALVGARVHEFL